MPKIALIGDSVLDNFYWLSEPTEDIECQLNKLLKIDEKCQDFSTINFAVDESTSFDLRHGSTPRQAYIDARRHFKMKPYPIDASDNLVKPLNLIENDSSITHVVVSIGGNDARSAFLKGGLYVDRIASVMINDGFIKNLNFILNKLIYDLKKEVVLVYCYHPLHTFFPLRWGLPPLFSTLTSLFKRMFPLILSLAIDYSIDIIDLSRSFNMYDHRYYGSTPIEPSNYSGEIIAKLILKWLNKSIGSESTNITINNRKYSKIFYEQNGLLFRDNLVHTYTEDKYVPGLDLWKRNCRSQCRSSNCSIL